MKKPTPGRTFIGGVIRENADGTWDAFLPGKLGCKSERAAIMTLTRFHKLYPDWPRFYTNDKEPTT